MHPATSCLCHRLLGSSEPALARLRRSSPQVRLESKQHNMTKQAHLAVVPRLPILHLSAQLLPVTTLAHGTNRDARTALLQKIALLHCSHAKCTRAI